MLCKRPQQTDGVVPNTDMTHPAPDSFSFPCICLSPPPSDSHVPMCTRSPHTPAHTHTSTKLAMFLILSVKEHFLHGAVIHVSLKFIGLEIRRQSRRDGSASLPGLLLFLLRAPSSPSAPDECRVAGRWCVSLWQSNGAPSDRRPLGGLDA